MATTLDNVIGQMRALGMPDISAHELRLDTRKWVRYGPKKRAYYRIERRTSRAGNEYYAGVFGYKGQGPYTVQFEGPQLSPEEIRALEERRRLAQEREARQRERDIARAANNARDTWREADVNGTSPYLQRKHVDHASLHGWIRFLGPNVVVPMVRYDVSESGRLRGVQIIRADGEKRFTAGMVKVGTACVLGTHTPGRPLLIAEGLATAASCYLALEGAVRVVVAFDSGNLLPVALVMRKLYPDVVVGFCADDDYLTDEPGRKKAARAAKGIGRASYMQPSFANAAKIRSAGLKLTDFNDLHVTEGLASVRHQLGLFVRYLETL